MTEEFRVLGKIKHRESFYLILLNKKHEKYFIKETTSGDYDYPDVEEYLELNKLYNSGFVVYGTKTINIKPMVRVKEKLVPLVVASSLLFSLVGCGTIEDTTKSLADNGIYLEDGIIKNDNLYILSKIDKGAKSNDYLDISQIKDYPYSKQCVPAEFSKIMGLENITYNDIRDAINGNKNIKEEDKKILLDAIDNLEKKNFNMDLAVLYYNLINLKIDYRPIDEFSNLAGYFNHFTKTAIIVDEFAEDNNQNKDIRKITLIHEIIGHGSTRTYFPDEDGILCDISYNSVNINEKGSITGTGTIGHTFMEAIAEMITYYGTNKEISYGDSGYIVEMYYLQALCNSNGVSMVDFANNGINYLMTKMLENNVKDPQFLIMIGDIKLQLLQSGNLTYFDTELDNVLVEYYKEKIDRMISEGMNSEQIKATITSWLEGNKNGIKEGMGVFDTDNLIVHSKYQGAIAISPHLIEEQIEDYLNSIFNVKSK